MFEGDLTELDTHVLLSVGAEFRVAEDRAAVRQLEVAPHGAPKPTPTTSRRSHGSTTG
jgi:hypothetical protein